MSAVLEPPRRRFFSRRTIVRPLINCENCGAELRGPYCARCGQHAVDYRRSLGRVLLDAADSFLNWDTKFLSTIGLLLTRPWKLTNDFNAGRRARYVHPLRLYLLASVAFFLLAKVIHFDAANAIRFEPKDRAEMDAALARLAAADSGLSDEERAKIEAARGKLAQATGTTSDEDRKQLASALSTLIGASMKETLKEKDRAKLDAALEKVAQVPTAPTELQLKDKTPPGPELSPAAAPAPSKGIESGRVRHSDEKERPQNSEFENWLESRIKDKIGEGGTKSKLFLETLRSNIPTMMLCCIPLFAFILKVLYARQRRFYVEHLIYALHIHTFAYVAVVVVTLLAMAAAGWLPGAQGLIIGVLITAAAAQVFLSIRRVYRQGWFLSTFKFLIGGIAYFVVLILAVGATAFITLLLPA